MGNHGWVKCEACDGTGYSPDRSALCSRCRGATGRPSAAEARLGGTAPSPPPPDRLLPLVWRVLVAAVHLVTVAAAVGVMLACDGVRWVARTLAFRDPTE